MKTKHLPIAACLLLATHLTHAETTKSAVPDQTDGRVIFREDFESGDFNANGWRFFAVNGAQGTGEITADAASEGLSGLRIAKISMSAGGDTAFDREGSPLDIPPGADALVVLFDARRAPGCKVPTLLRVAAVANGRLLHAAEFLLGDEFQTFSVPVTPKGDPINLRFDLLDVGMEAQIDNIRVLDVTAGNRLLNGDFKLWQNDAPVHWRAFSVNPGDVTVERADLGEEGTAALLRRHNFGEEDGGLDTWTEPTPVRAGETPTLKFASSKLDGDLDTRLVVAIVLLKPDGTAPTLAAEAVIPESDFAETNLTPSGPVTEDGSIVVAFRPYDAALKTHGVGGFLIRNVRLEISKGQ